MFLVKAGGYASVIVCLILITRCISFKYVSKQFFVVLWMIATIRFLFVFELPYEINIFNIQNNTDVSENLGTIVIDSAIFKPVHQDSLTQSVSAPENENTYIDGNYYDKERLEINFTKICKVVYYIGVLGAASTIIILYLMSLRKIRKGYTITDDYISDVVSSFGIKRKVRIVGLDDINTAFTYGIFRITIVVPMDFWMMEKSRQKIVIEHEMMHIASFDYLKLLMIELAVVIHWFNPFVYILFIVAKRDMEYYCDERVILKHGENIKKEYALTIMETITGKPYSLKLYNTFGYKDIKNRITAVMNTKQVTKRVKINCNILLSIGMALSIITGCSAMTRGSKESPDKSTGILESKEETLEADTTTEVTSEVATGEDEELNENEIEITDYEDSTESKEYMLEDDWFFGEYWTLSDPIVDSDGIYWERCIHPWVVEHEFWLYQTRDISSNKIKAEIGTLLYAFGSDRNNWIYLSTEDKAISGWMYAYKSDEYEGVMLNDTEQGTYSLYKLFAMGNTGGVTNTTELLTSYCGEIKGGKIKIADDKVYRKGFKRIDDIKTFLADNSAIASSAAGEALQKIVDSNRMPLVLSGSTYLYLYIFNTNRQDDNMYYFDAMDLTNNRLYIYLYEDVDSKDAISRQYFCLSEGIVSSEIPDDATYIVRWH